MKITSDKKDYTKKQTFTDIDNLEIEIDVNDIDGLQTALDQKVDNSEKGIADGVASLDTDAKVPNGQLPLENNIYSGLWNGSLNIATKNALYDKMEAFVETSEIKDDLISTEVDQPLSANQGKELKTLIDNISSATDKITGVDENTIIGRNDAGNGDSEELTPVEVRVMINVADGSTANDTDANLKDRANHTGTQVASTISDFDAEVSNNPDVTANTAKTTNVTTNLSNTKAVTTNTIVSSDGNDAVIDLADAVNAGLLSPTEKTSISTINDKKPKQAGTVDQVAVRNTDGTERYTGVTINSNDDLIIPTADGDIYTNKAKSELVITGITDVSRYPKVNLKIKNDPDSLFSVLAYSHDNISINFDCYHDAGWTAGDTTTAQLYKTGDKLKVISSSGNIKGETIPSASTFDAFYIDLISNNAWFAENVSADSFTDRTPYPKTLQLAYDSVNSMQRLPDGEYKEDDKGSQLDHNKLHDYLKADTDKNARDMSATISVLNEVVKDLIKRIEVFENK